MKLRAWALLTAFLLPTSGLATPSATDLPVQARVSGEAESESVFTLPPGGRLSVLLIAAQPRDTAYLLGAALLREHERAQQVRLRAGLAHDLAELQRSPSPVLAEAAASLSVWLQAHEPTGRIVPQLMDMRLLQVQPLQNPVLQQGDVVQLPARPTTVRVIGAVAQACTLDHEPRRDAKAYLRSCPATVAADPDLLFVIQPDGRVQQLGSAAWNRSDPQPVAPGGTVYVPLRVAASNGVDEHFNEEFAAFIATQPIAP